MKRILFFAEAVTLAHVARPAALAAALEPGRYEILFAVNARAWRFLGEHGWRVLPLNSVDEKAFLRSLARGSPVYDASTLHSYVREDRTLIEALRPDLIIGDFRLSLSVSARLAGVPYAALCNAYWSPYATQRYTVPQIPLTRVLPPVLANSLFRLARPLAFAFHTLPLNRVRRAYGLPSLGLDLRRTYTDADHVLYVDSPGLIPLRGLPDNHHYLGPVLWSPPVPNPAWWDELPTDRPVVYATLGSSGPAELLPRVLDALAPLPVTVIAATGGKSYYGTLPANARQADYLPGGEAARRATLVICNGGSPTTQQALAAGVPVLGIAANLDQFLNMQYIVGMGAGRLLRADQAQPHAIRIHVEQILSDDSKSQVASQVAEDFRHYPAPERFIEFVQNTLS